MILKVIEFINRIKNYDIIILKYIIIMIIIFFIIKSNNIKLLNIKADGEQGMLELNYKNLINF